VSSPEAIELARALRDAIRARDPGAKAGTNGDIARWARDFDLILRLDKRNKNQISEVIAWCQKPGCFWAANILSGRKLREKYDTLLAQMERERAGREPAVTERSLHEQLFGKHGGG
jgi:hypothetical protein